MIRSLQRPSAFAGNVPRAALRQLPQETCEPRERIATWHSDARRLGDGVSIEGPPLRVTRHSRRRGGCTHAPQRSPGTQRASQPFRPDTSHGPIRADAPRPTSAHEPRSVAEADSDGTPPDQSTAWAPRWPSSFVAPPLPGRAREPSFRRPSGAFRLLLRRRTRVRASARRQPMQRRRSRQAPKFRAAQIYRWTYGPGTCILSGLALSLVLPSVVPDQVAAPRG